MRRMSILLQYFGISSIGNNQVFIYVVRRSVGSYILQVLFHLAFYNHAMLGYILLPCTSKTEALEI